MKKGLLLFVWICALQLIGALIGLLTKTDMTSWYHHLVKSSLTPPNFVFGITWSILYVCIAISGWLLWQSNYSIELKRTKSVYLAQLLLNWLWTPLFFHFHLTGMALICLLFIIIFTLLTMLWSWKISQVASYLLFPYVLWCSFAAYLNAFIYFTN